MAPDEQVAQLGHPGAHLMGAEHLERVGIAAQLASGILIRRGKIRCPRGHDHRRPCRRRSAGRRSAPAATDGAPIDQRRHVPEAPALVEGGHDLLPRSLESEARWRGRWLVGELGRPDAPDAERCRPASVSATRYQVVPLETSPETVAAPGGPALLDHVHHSYDEVFYVVRASSSSASAKHGSKVGRAQ